MKLNHKQYNFHAGAEPQSHLILQGFSQQAKNWAVSAQNPDFLQSSFHSMSSLDVALHLLKHLQSSTGAHPESISEAAVVSEAFDKISLLRSMALAPITKVRARRMTFFILLLIGCVWLLK